MPVGFFIFIVSPVLSFGSNADALYADIFPHSAAYHFVERRHDASEYRASIALLSMPNDESMP